MSFLRYGFDALFSGSFCGSERFQVIFWEFVGLSENTSPKIFCNSDLFC